MATQQVVVLAQGCDQSFQFRLCQRNDNDNDTLKA